MPSDFLTTLIEYNNWVNVRIIDACESLTDQQLDAKAATATKGSIRETLWHLMTAQQRMVWRVTGAGSIDDDIWQDPPSFAELREAALASGEQLLAIAEESPQATVKTQFGGIDYLVEPSVVMAVALNHAAEHREQINSMLSTLGIKPPEGGWMFGVSTGALREADAAKQ